MSIKDLNLKKIRIDKTFLRETIKGSLFALIISLILVLIFGIVIKLVDVSNDIIMPINQVIKVLSIFIGVILSVKIKQNGAFKGLFVGIIYTLLSTFVFLILGGNLKSTFNYIDLIFGTVMGIISGIVAVNTGKRL